MDPIITSAITSFVTSVATNTSTVPMKTLDDLWYLAFGGFNNLVDKKRAERDFSLAEYKNSIAQKVMSINESDLQPPPMSVVGPALEASKYYIEEEELREMFANIIANSMNSTKSSNVHHAFVEIIKQITPEEARLIKLFQSKTDFPIVQYKKVDKKNQGFHLFKTNVFNGYLDDIVTGDENATAVTNFQRLGLVTISYEENYTNIDIYKIYKDTTFFKECEKVIDSEQYSMVLGEGIMRLTPLGEKFITVCL